VTIRTIARDGKLIEVETLPSPPAVAAKSKRREPYIHVDMDQIIKGLNSVGRLWVYLLRQNTIRPGSPIAVSTKHLKELGVSRFAKADAIASLERKGLIAVVEAGRGRNPRVKLLV
jgi:hypothetical protein